MKIFAKMKWKKYKKIVVRSIALELAVIQLLGISIQTFAANESMPIENYDEQNIKEDFQIFSNGLSEEDEIESGRDGEKENKIESDGNETENNEEKVNEENQIKVSYIILNKDFLEMEINSVFSLVATAYDEKGEVVDADFQWNSNNIDIVEIDETGTIIAKLGGQATITVSSEDVYAECVVVVNVPIVDISLDKSSISLQKGQSEQLTAKLLPDDTTENAVIEWTSTDANVVSVDETGMITAKAAGKAVITAKCKDFISNCEVEVIVPIEKVLLDKTKLSLKKKQIIQLNASIIPTDTTEDVALKWISSNTSVAVVDGKGTVTAVGTGQAEICVSTKNGVVSEICQITVTSEEWYTGWKRINNAWYYYDASGIMQTGWQKISGFWYYLNSSGVMQTGWKKIAGVWYYLNSSGVMQVGWQKISGKWYYLNRNGAMQVGWQKISGNWYYLNSSGVMQTGWLVQGTKRYYFKNSGELQTGWVMWSGKWYYYDADGNIQTGWQRIFGKWYYLNASGIMQTGWQKISGKWYYLDNSGVMQTGWIRLNNIWYYLKSDGVMATGWQKLGNIWYYLKADGAMATGWLKLGNAWYYLNVSGAMQTGWARLNNMWYYLKTDGSMATGWIKLGGTWYYLKSSGVMITGWLNLNGYWYYLNGDGAMATGWQKINGVWYYFISSGEMKTSSTNGPVTFRSGNVLQVSKCEASSYNESRMTVTLEAARSNSIENLSSTFYIVMLNSKGTELLDVVSGNVSKGSVFQISATFSSDDSFRTNMMGKYAIAIKQGYSYEVISSSMFLSNPEITASKDESFKDKYWGYYEGYKITSKKGMQGVADAYTEDLRVQHLLLNVDIQDLVWTRAASGYIPYNYKGKTYYFSDLVALKKTIYDLHGWGSREGNAYGENHTRNVTVVLLMSWKYDELSYLIHPSARSKGRAPYYALNMQDENSRQTFEALFCYLGEELGQMKERVNNWTLGNEVNSCNSWNYSGGMSLSTCVENYAQAFQLLNQGIKRTASSPRLFISLDHCWNTSDAGHSGKAFLDEFAAYMSHTAPLMQWNVNYHPYSQPLKNAAFWKDYFNTTDSVNTAYISMRNINVLTGYLTSLEAKYGKTSNSIRVILGEIGFSAVGGNKTEERLQSAALGYGYYIAMFNDRIDAYIIRAYMDDQAETSSGLFLGLRRNDSAQTAKESYVVYKNLDTSQSFTVMNQYLGTIGIDSWQKVIPQFDKNALVANGF